MLFFLLVCTAQQFSEPQSVGEAQQFSEPQQCSSDGDSDEIISTSDDTNDSDEMRGNKVCMSEYMCLWACCALLVTGTTF